MGLQDKNNFEHRIKSKPYCFICNSLCVDKINTIEGFNIWRCSSCSFDFVWPTPAVKEMKNIYDRRDYYEGGEIGGYNNYDEQTAPSLVLFEDILKLYGDGAGRSILDIGCGYGLHMKMAQDKGWNCFGVEPSSHARNIAKERYKNSLFIVDYINNLIPHEFDLIIMLDLIEHISDPCRELFYQLFRIGAITPKTDIIITTPNARSFMAITEASKWKYLHHPSHLSYYSGQALQKLFEKLLFQNIQVDGIYPVYDFPQATLPKDESVIINSPLSFYEGLLCKISGSTFKSFIQERYVPGTWSNLAKYEHLPRYILAKKLIDGSSGEKRGSLVKNLFKPFIKMAYRDVLDFGCGVGYGARILAEVAEKVTALDIDEKALIWAGKYNHAKNVKYCCSSDFGADIPSQSFDLITCFEVIEHLEQLAQKELLAALKRMLKINGVLLISTPNPEVTAKYGENQYHLHEMHKDEFSSLLGEEFANVQILEQRMAPAVFLSDPTNPREYHLDTSGFNCEVKPSIPVAYVAVCSTNKIIFQADLCYADYENDLVDRELTEKKRYYDALEDIIRLKNESERMF